MRKKIGIYILIIGLIISMVSCDERRPMTEEEKEKYVDWLIEEINATDYWYQTYLFSLDNSAFELDILQKKKIMKVSYFDKYYEKYYDGKNLYTYRYSTMEKEKYPNYKWEEEYREVYVLPIVERVRSVLKKENIESVEGNNQSGTMIFGIKLKQNILEKGINIYGEKIIPDELYVDVVIKTLDGVKIDKLYSVYAKNDVREVMGFNDGEGSWLDKEVPARFRKMA